MAFDHSLKAEDRFAFKLIFSAIAEGISTLLINRLLRHQRAIPYVFLDKYVFKTIMF